MCFWQRKYSERRTACGRPHQKSSQTSAARIALIFTHKGENNFKIGPAKSHLKILKPGLTLQRVPS